MTENVVKNLETSKHLGKTTKCRIAGSASEGVGGGSKKEFQLFGNETIIKVLIGMNQSQIDSRKLK